MSWNGRQKSSQTESGSLRQEVWISLKRIKQENKIIRSAFRNDHSDCAENWKGKEQKQIRQVATQVVMAWTTRKANTKKWEQFQDILEVASTDLTNGLHVAGISKRILDNSQMLVGNGMGTTYQDGENWRKKVWSCGENPEFYSGHVNFVKLIEHPNADAKQAPGQMSLELRGKLNVGYVYRIVPETKQQIIQFCF